MPAECLCPTPPHLSFSTGMDFSSVEGRPLWRFSDVLTSARCTQISRWMASLCGSSAVYVLPGSNVSRENPRSLASPLFNTRRFFAAVAALDPAFTISLWLPWTLPGRSCKRPVGGCKRSLAPKGRNASSSSSQTL